MKKIIITSLIILILLTFSIIIYPVVKNDLYQKKLINNIYKNTDIENVEYVNNDNNYYITKDKEKITVYNLNYEEVYTILLKEIKPSNLDLTYRRNNLYYIDKKVGDNAIKYTFYDIKSLDKVYETLVGGI